MDRIRSFAEGGCSSLTLPDLGIIVFGVLALAGALWVLKLQPKLEMSYSLLICSATLCLLCFGIGLESKASLLRSGGWMYWPVAGWWLASTFGRTSLRFVRARGFLSLGLALLIVIGIMAWGDPFRVSDADLHPASWGGWISLVGVGFWLAATLNYLITMRAAVGQPRLRRVAAIGAFSSLLPLWPETVSSTSGFLPDLSLWMAAAMGSITYIAMIDWIIRHREREGDLQFGRPVAYVSFAVSLLGFYLLLIGGVGKAVEWMGGDVRTFFSALGGVLLAVLGISLVLSGRVWERLRAHVDRHFTPGEFDFREEWIGISEELSTLPDPRDLGRTLADLLADRMRSSTVCLYRRADDTRLELWSNQGTITDPPEFLELHSEWVVWLWRNADPLEWNGIKAPDKPIALTGQTRMVVPLIAKQQIVAIAFLGGRTDAFTAEEKLWLAAAGQQAALAVLAADLTERLIETRELASYHRLSAFVIHDVKNAISMLSLLLQNLEEGRDAINTEVSLSTLRQTTDKLQALVERFASARESFKLTRRAVNLHDLCTAVTRRIGESFPKVEIKLQPVTGMTVHGDADQLTRVLDNLCINACEAMMGKGTLSLTLCEESSGVMLRVSDTGPGMDDGFIRERLFHPFATTKQKGLGIGLYQSREIARAHGGRLTARSAPGSGAEFMLWLPGSAHSSP